MGPLKVTSNKPGALTKAGLGFNILRGPKGNLTFVPMMLTNISLWSRTDDVHLSSSTAVNHVTHTHP